VLEYPKDFVYTKDNTACGTSGDSLGGVPVSCMIMTIVSLINALKLKVL
jgi:hypothetical protein